ncbi:DNA-packaging protein [Paenibacillus lautus]|uniref:DNA-packaging protein n=1 Tax=Paenibacillus lautus TaxID=1401 RepID=UPI002DBF16B3|nr:DNA-packaging protein [Paenibacillus lautus]MEC0310178.1 DNA-packaging protein [Paenibacillus lautus]
MISSSDVWPIIKVRLGLVDEKLKPLIDTYIAEIERRIKHYCNIKSLPDDLLFVWASMVTDAIRVDLPNVDEIDDTVGGQAGNVKVGDTSVAGGGGSGGGLTNTSKAVIDQVVFDYRTDLHHYRRMGWGR